MRDKSPVWPLLTFAIAMVLTWNGSTRLNADLVVQHNDAADPTTQGWVDTGGNQPAGPVFNDMGFDAWSIDDSSTVGGSFRAYSHQLDGSQIAAAFSNGWRMSTTLRVIDDADAIDFSVSVLFNAETISFGMAFGTQADGDPIVQLIDGFSNPDTTGPTFVLEGTGGGYHSYDLVYDTSSGTADLFVDGIERISDYGGYTFDVPTSTRIAFGAQQSNSTGHAHYNNVSFFVVPEPTSLGLLLVSALSLVHRRVRSDHND